MLRVKEKGERNKGFGFHIELFSMKFIQESKKKKIIFLCSSLVSCVQEDILESFSLEVDFNLVPTHLTIQEFEHRQENL